MLFAFAAHAQDENIYRNIIYKAETELTKGNYKAAVKQYQTAFRVEKNPFSSDLINAFKAALLSGSRKEIKSLWVEGRNDVYFVKQVKKDELLLSYTHPSLRKKVRSYSVIEWPKTRLEQITDSILNEDQALRNRCPNNLRSECIELFKQRDSVHVFFLRDLLLAKPYTRKDLSSSVLKCLNIIALHARRFGYTTLDSLFISYTKKGFIRPNLYAGLNTYQTDLSEDTKKKLAALPKLGFGQSYIQINDTAFLIRLPDSMTAIYNKNRHDLLMDDVHREMAKFRFAWSQPLFKKSFADLGLFNAKEHMSKNEEKELIDRLRPILIQ